MPARDSSPPPFERGGFRPLQLTLAALVIAFLVGERRGLPIALVVLVWCLGVLLGVPRIPKRGHRWSAVRPVLETSIVVPLVLAVTAIATDLPLGICALIALAAWPALWLLGRRRRHREQA